MDDGDEMGEWAAAPPGRVAVLHGGMAELTRVHPILGYGGPFGAPSSPTEP
jgi:hypothetical protein